jgi:hypothetical protein
MRLPCVWRTSAEHANLLSTVTYYRRYRKRQRRRTLICSNARSGSDSKSASTSPLPQRPQPDGRHFIGCCGDSRGFSSRFVGRRPIGTARNLIPLSRFPQGESRGGDGSPHAAHAACQPKPLARTDAAAPPARGVSKRSAEPPLAPSPRVGLSRCTASRWSAQSEDDRTRKRIKDGRHVVLDFYDLLIEPILKSILSVVPAPKENPQSGKDPGRALPIECVELSRTESYGY